jgi:hypothetical protein
MINTIIFSKDRACQLDLLLRSFKHYFVEWRQLNVSIICKATNGAFKKGYDKTLIRHPEFKFIFETNFRSDLCRCNFSKDKTMFFVDDDVFINPVSLNDNVFKLFEQNKDITCISLRMNPLVNSCYTQKQRPAKTPPLSNDLIWNWRIAAQSDLWQGYPSDWGYPMSVDGHIFRTNEVLNKIQMLNYQSPNFFEGALASTMVNGSQMICFKNSIIFNNPINKVQTSNGNEAGIIKGCSAEFINDRYISGEYLDFTPYTNIRLLAPHQEESLFFKKEN